MKSIVLTLLTLIVLAAPPTVSSQSSFQGVGDLPGGVFQSHAWDVSGDGTIVVGRSVSTDNHTLAFRWVDTLGIMALDPTIEDTGIHAFNEASAISFDGTTIVGSTLLGGNGRQPMSWTASGGLKGRGLYTNIDPNKYQDGRATGVSSDGSKMVGLITVEVPDPGYYQATPFSANLPGGPMNLLPAGDTTSFAWAWDVSGDGSVIVGGYSATPDPGNLDPIEAARWVNGSRTNIGSLGAGYQNVAHVISNNGHYIAGLSNDGTTVRVFRWSQAGGMDSIGTVPYLSEGPTIRGISGNGRVVVGTDGIPSHPFIWMEGDSMRNLQDFLANELGVDLGGWTLTAGMGLSDDGSVVVGYGKNDSGYTEGWVANLTYLKIREPEAGELWIAGEQDTIRWTALGVDTLIMHYSINYDSSADTGRWELLDFDVPADDGYYVWDPPDTLLSKTCAIRIASQTDSTVADTSDLFKIRPYILTRDSAGYWEPFRFGEDRWAFSNSAVNLWPQNWYNRFNYQTGTNPQLGFPYPQDTAYPFFTAKSPDFPDWPLWGETWTYDQVYTISTLDFYKPSALKFWKTKKKKWGGSCFGFTISALLAFRDSTSYRASFPAMPTITPLHDVPIDTNVRKIINRLWVSQMGQPHKAIRDLNYKTVTPTQTIFKLEDLLLQDAPDLGSLSFWNNDTGGGGHSIIAYGLRHDEADTNIHYVDVYDNSDQNNADAVITVDISANGGNGTWNYPRLAKWGGKKWFLIEDPASFYLTTPALPKTDFGAAPLVAPAGVYEISAEPIRSVLIDDGLGGRLGFVNNIVVDSLPGAVPFTPPTGAETPPYSYTTPPGAYNITVSDFQEGTSSLTVFTDSSILSSDRFDAIGSQTDRYSFDGALSVFNTDPESKMLQLQQIIIEDSTSEKVFDVRGLRIDQGDSIKIARVNHDHLALETSGSDRTYTLTIEVVSTLGHPRFYAPDIPLTGNSTQTIVPGWPDFGTPLEIYIDLGRDGTIDDTLFVSGTVGVDERGPVGIPQEFTLLQNYPNPFNPTTRIPYSVGQTSFVRIVVYDVLGREVGTLVERTMLPGFYEAMFDASGLPAGVYHVRMTAGEFSGTVRLMYVK